ncbi:MAG: DUF2306 domain-containing protein [Undibacterium sp.]|uniref:DUF2306 domain-containing protein n=1 Tax=Undibacterium sp. TaxID=1914977 RepID=UPI0027251FCE|nr:DUF2306 domain-containing protein [Undibacterium sp.]MDO8653193.1 DUF2306 domain-containing protein [Undibacterium sp.]
MIMKRLINLEKRIGWVVPTALFLLSVVPVLAGFVRLSGLVAGGPATPENARFIASPLPIVVHLLSATLFCLLGAFQFSSTFRQSSPGWHRLVGRLLVPFGLFAGLSGLWMTVMYPIDLQQQGALLYSFRLLVGSGMVLSIFISLLAILHRDIAKHRAWMIRGYALGQGAGTQALLGIPWMLAFGELSGLPRDVLMSAAWMINLALAEWIIRR